MNVTSNHPKLRTTLRFADPSYIAGDAVSGKMEVECKAEKGLAVGAIMVELFGIEGESCISLWLLLMRLATRAYIPRSLCETNVLTQRTHLPRTWATTV